MEQEEFDILLRFFKVLANKSRLRILGILANQECSVGELAALLGLKEPNVSHHLAKLQELGLVDMCSEGHTCLYWLDGEALQGINREILSSEKMASLVDDVEGEVWERKVLKNFFEGERLKRIPASRKKCLVILRWLATQFEVGVQYPERKVNEIIKRYHPDCATLRRELISEKLMQRENGIYWRLPEVSHETILWD